MSSTPNVTVAKRTSQGLGIAIKRLKGGEIVGTEHPKNGYFYVAWVKTPHKLTQEVTNLFRTKRTAECVASMLNAMTRREAILLIRKLYERGANDHAAKIAKSRGQSYSGRSFEWLRG